MFSGIAYADITETNFTWIVPSTAANTIYQWIQPTEDPLDLKRNDVFDVNLEVGCINDDCGDMNVSLYYSTDSICATQFFVDNGNDLSIETGTNPFNCGDMNSGEFCYAVFQVKGNSYGDYELWGKIDSVNADTNYTECGERTINVTIVEDIPLLMKVTGINNNGWIFWVIGAIIIIVLGVFLLVVRRKYD